MAAILIGWALTAAAAQPVSPNGKLTGKAKGQGLVVFYQKQPVLEVLSVEGADVPLQLQFTQRVTADYQMVSGKRLHCTNEANEYRSGNLQLRVYNDGIAFRTTTTDKVNDSRQTIYRIPEGTRRWMQQWCDSYEGFFPLDTTCHVRPVPSYSGISKSADGWNNRWGYPALVEPVDGIFTLITEADIQRGHSASCLYNDGELYKVMQAPSENAGGV